MMPILPHIKRLSTNCKAQERIKYHDLDGDRPREPPLVSNQQDLGAFSTSSLERFKLALQEAVGSMRHPRTAKSFVSNRLLS